MLRRKKKKGAAHFEMIVSFVFFATFIFFLFIVLRPYDTSTLSGAVITGMYDSFEEEVHTNLTNVFLKANDTTGSPCFKILLPNHIFTYAFTESIVRDVNGSDIDSNLVSSDLNLDDSENKTFYKVAISPDFSDEDVSGCTALDDYDLGDPIERRVVSYDSLENMSQRYVDDYSGLRADLNVPEVFDFAITSTDLPEINMESHIPDGGDVIANEYILEVLYSNGSVVNARFNLMLW